MKLLMKLFFVFSFLQLSTSCDNELDVIDDYQETPVIYGLLNLTDSTQYIRVQKAYLGEGNALLMAQNSDSIYYDTTDITLKLQESVNGVLTRTIPLIVDATHPKDEGLFVGLAHILYRTPGEALIAQAQYKLIFNNIKTGKTVTGSTKIVGKMQTPSILGINEIDIPDDNPFVLKVTPVTNGKVYGLHVIFNYAEEKKSLNPVHHYEYKSLDFAVPNIVNTNLSSNQYLTFSFNGSDFYSFIGSHIKVDSLLSRPALLTTLDFVFTTGAEDFYIYYSVNQPNNNITQSIPDFTNLSEGKGIFSSRNKRIFANYKLKSKSIDILLNSTYTHGRFD